MLARYKMYYRIRPPEDPLPQGIRQDSRKHTGHCLRPTEEIVVQYLDDLTDKAWGKFETEYLSILEKRFYDNRRPFDQLAETAMTNNVFIGCSCPTKKNPDINHCHTILALRFMKLKYPELEVVVNPTSEH